MIELNGEINIDFLEKAINVVIERHEALRSNFIADQEGYKVVVKDEVEISLQFIDISSYTRDAEQENQRVYSPRTSDII